jgi:uncharacterized membrane protein YqjE
VQESATGTGRSISDVVADIGLNLADLLRSEIRFARAEVRERVQSSGVLLVAGVVASLLSAFFLLLSILYALRTVIPPWAAALCIAAGTALIATIALTVGMRRLKGMQPSRTTAESVKEKVQWARVQTK